jgi:hypothetical protein
MSVDPVRRLVALLRAAASFALLAPLAAAAPPAHALVTLANDGNGNTTPPADNFGFANVGVMSNGLTGVYLGNGWVITASHVGPANITLAGNVYALVPGSWVHLQHSESPNLLADLGMERISGSPPLPSLVIAHLAPAVGETVSMAGNGWARQPNQTCWDGSWNELSCALVPAYRGYKSLVGATPGPRWGRNQITMTSVDVDLAGMRTRSFETSFDASGGLPEEAQAVVGDSGGGAFVKRGSQWQLAGILFAIATFENQPADSAVFGDHTYSVDLSYYRSQIMNIMNPPVVPALPWQGLVLAAGVLLGSALSVRRRARS